MPNEDSTREQLAACARILAMKGLVGLYGHVSSCDFATGRVYLTLGAGSDRANVTPEELWVFDLDGQKLSGEGRMAAEWPIHVAIHAARRDAVAVAHLHAPYSTLFAIAKREFRPVTLTGAIFGDGVPLFHELGLVTTMEQGRRLASELGSHRAILMRGHGSAVVGASIEELAHACLVLEDNAQKFYQAAALGEVQTFSPEECEIIHSGRVPGHLTPAWAYLTRQEQRWDRQPETAWHPLE
ncbi:MAG TPA: class II aldolase/adducin family protein [Chloroflexota bacterium]